MWHIDLNLTRCYILFGHTLLISTQSHSPEIKILIFIWPFDFKLTLCHLLNVHLITHCFIFTQPHNQEIVLKHRTIIISIGMCTVCSTFTLPTWLISICSHNPGFIFIQVVTFSLGLIQLESSSLGRPQIINTMQYVLFRSEKMTSWKLACECRLSAAWPPNSLISKVHNECRLQTMYEMQLPSRRCDVHVKLVLPGEGRRHLGKQFGARLAWEEQWVLPLRLEIWSSDGLPDLLHH